MNATVRVRSYLLVCMYSVYVGAFMRAGVWACARACPGIGQLAGVCTHGKGGRRTGVCTRVLTDIPGKDVTIILWLVAISVRHLDTSAYEITNAAVPPPGVECRLTCIP